MSSSSFQAKNNENSFPESDLKLKNSSHMNNSTKTKSYWTNSNTNTKSRNLSKRYSYPNQQGSAVAQSFTSDVQNKNSTVDYIEKLKPTAGGWSGIKHKNSPALTYALATNTVSTTNTKRAETTSTSTSPSTSTLAVSNSTRTIKGAFNSSTFTENSRMTLASTSIATATKPKSTVAAPKATKTLTTYTLGFLRSMGVLISRRMEESSLGPTTCQPSLYDSKNSRTASAQNSYSNSRARAPQHERPNNGNNRGDGIDAMGFSAPDIHRYHQPHQQPQQHTIPSSVMQKEHSDNFVVVANIRKRRNKRKGRAALNSGHSGYGGIDYGGQLWHYNYYNPHQFHCMYDPDYLLCDQQQYSAAEQHSP